MNGRPRFEAVELVAVRGRPPEETAITQAVHVNIVSRRVRHVVGWRRGKSDEQQCAQRAIAA